MPASWTLLTVVPPLVLGRAGGVFPREYPGLAASWNLVAALVGLVTLRRLREVPLERRAATRVDAVACPGDQLVTVSPTSLWPTC